MDIEKYLNSVIAIHKTGAATEHSYRATLQDLLSSIEPNITALNEPKREECGAPDFHVMRGEIVAGYVEAKDIGKDLSNLKGYEKDQQARYTKALSNLIYTNCLDFDFFQNGERVASVTIASVDGGIISPMPENFATLESLLQNFAAQRHQTITSAEKLAEIMAGKAVLIKDVLFKVLTAQDAEETELYQQFKAFQDQLIHDITKKDFADVYAETIAYGMFAARLHDKTLENFSRQEALELLPKSNPFLRALFVFIAGHNLDDRLKWIIDDLADIFQAANVEKLLSNFNALTRRKDPFIHFYETFLSKYNPAKRKARGVWYTPEPVVQFIVRAVDEVLQSEFGLRDGLADTSKITVDWSTGQVETTKKGTTVKSGKIATMKKDVHRVQILDPATGTGTFLAEVVKQIAPKIQSVAQGMWSGYIEQDLIPRLHGFELLMASYAMCHMKLDMILSELGYVPTKTPPRLGVYLTNSLEEGEPANQTLPFAQWLAKEIKGANEVKCDTPVMCIIGNPPYSGESVNKGQWILDLMEAYKKEPGGHAKLQERNSKWINDDYVKFIRMSEDLIIKNGEGVLAFITNHGYLDNPTFRGMRWHLLNTFNKIWVLDLHGNAKKKEVSPDGTPDKNVFDIQQGVAIIIAVKHKKSGKDKPLAAVFHRDLWGARQNKYTALEVASTRSNDWTQLEHNAPQYPFVQRDYGLQEAYESYLYLPDLFSENGNPSPGAVSTHDQFAISNTKAEGIDKVTKLLSTETEFSARKIFKLCSQKQWDYARAKTDLSSVDWQNQFVNIDYRTFDNRYTIYNRHVYVHRRERLNHHMLLGYNMGLITCRQSAIPEWYHAFVGSTMIDDCFISNRTKERSYCFPLYLYPAEDDLDQTHRVNFDPKLYKKLQKLATHPTHGIPDEVVVFDYIYGVLHCPDYREKYAQFLKIDFPRIPWPVSPDIFWDTRAKGETLRKLHLMQPDAIGETPYPFNGTGDNTVEKPEFRDNKVWINPDQFFEGVPEIAWNFYIGGYQPAQKWLKDRKGRKLSFDDVRHYQAIIKILSETDRIMKTIELDLAN